MLLNRAAAVAALFVGLSAVSGSAQVVGRSTLGVSTSSLQLVARGYRASKIIGSSVYDTSRHKIVT